MSEHTWTKVHGDIYSCVRCGVVTMLDGSYDGPDCLGEVRVSKIATLEHDLTTKDAEVSAVVASIPGAIRVREPNGPENIYASLAVSVAKVVCELTTALKQIAELEQALERARVVQRGVEEGR